MSESNLYPKQILIVHTQCDFLKQWKFCNNYLKKKIKNIYKETQHNKLENIKMKTNRDWIVEDPAGVY